jgi:hypothetical protein
LWCSRKIPPCQAGCSKASILSWGALLCVNPPAGSYFLLLVSKIACIASASALELFLPPGPISHDTILVPRTDSVWFQIRTIPIHPGCPSCCNIYLYTSVHWGAVCASLLLAVHSRSCTASPGSQRGAVAPHWPSDKDVISCPQDRGPHAHFPSCSPCIGGFCGCCLCSSWASSARWASYKAGRLHRTLNE